MKHLWLHELVFKTGDRVAISIEGGRLYFDKAFSVDLDEAAELAAVLTSMKNGNGYARRYTKERRMTSSLASVRWVQGVDPARLFVRGGIQLKVATMCRDFASTKPVKKAGLQREIAKQLKMTEKAVGSIVSILIHKKRALAVVS